MLPLLNVRIPLHQPCCSCFYAGCMVKCITPHKTLQPSTRVGLDGLDYGPFSTWVSDLEKKGENARLIGVNTSNGTVGTMCLSVVG